MFKEWIIGIRLYLSVLWSSKEATAEYKNETEVESNCMYYVNKNEGNLKCKKK